jgi:hypothetical protein
MAVGYHKVNFITAARRPVDSIPLARLYISLSRGAPKCPVSDFGTLLIFQGVRDLYYAICFHQVFYMYHLIYQPIFFLGNQIMT